MQLNENIAVGAGPHGRSVVCQRNVPRGEALFRLVGSSVREANKYTIQRGENDHLAPADATWALLNHACDPNCEIDYATWELVTRRPIAAGEEVTFNYLSTEWEMASPFSCTCGAGHCPGSIRGFRFLDRTQREAVLPLLSPFLKSRILVAVDAPAPL